jgi:SnoaL-like domain
MTEFVRALAERDRAAIDGLLADDVRFNSPVRSYDDRADVLHLLTTLGELFDELRPVREWTGSEGAASFVSVRVGDWRLDGVIEEIHGDDRRIAELTLMLRPLGALMGAVKEMGQALERAPLPSGASFTRRD